MSEPSLSLNKALHRTKAESLVSLLHCAGLTESNAFTAIFNTLVSVHSAGQRTVKLATIKIAVQGTLWYGRALLKSNAFQVSPSKLLAVHGSVL